MLERVALSISCALLMGAVAAFGLRGIARAMIASAGRRFTAAQRYRVLMMAFFMTALVYVALFVRLLSGAEITPQTASALLSSSAHVPSATLMLIARVATLLAVTFASAWGAIALVRLALVLYRAMVATRMNDAPTPSDRAQESAAAAASARSDDASALMEIVAAVSRRMNVAAPRVRISNMYSVPAVVGAWQPTLALPARLTALMSTEQIHLIVAHEIAHIVRHDTIMNTAQAYIESLFFLCPSMRALSRSCRAERELAADALAAQTFGAPLILARALERLETAQIHRPVALAVAADDGPLLRRIAALADAQRTSRSAGTSDGTEQTRPFDHARLFAVNAMVAIAAFANIAAVPGTFVDDALRLTVPAAAYRQDIRATDDAGPFTLRIVGYRAVAATFDGRSFPPAHIRQRGDAVRFVGNDGSTLLAVRLNPTGGMTWRSR